MKLYAQHGYGPSDKLDRAVEEALVQGVILSPRYLTPGGAATEAQKLRGINADTDILLDPEYYAIQFLGMPNAQLGKLGEDQWPHFIPSRQSALLAGPDRVDEILEKAYELQCAVGCTCLISPNIYVSKSFDSLEAAIALAFITRSKAVCEKRKLRTPVLATLAVTRNALMNQQEFEAFLAMLTAVEPKPDGIYLLLGAGNTDDRAGAVRSEIMIPEVIGGWMLLNYALTLNGIRVVNACSDLLSPLLTIAGANGVATGWWSNLQVFAMGRYIRNEGGGQQPLKRYISNRLLNRVTVSEREAFVALIPEIANGMKTDAYYDGGEPTRTEEALQCWDSIGALSRRAFSGHIAPDLDHFDERITMAEATYDELRANALTERYEANREYLDALRKGLKYFREKAEI